VHPLSSARSDRGWTSWAKSRMALRYAAYAGAPEIEHRRYPPEWMAPSANSWNLRQSNSRSAVPLSNTTAWQLARTGARQLPLGNGPIEGWTAAIDVHDSLVGRRDLAVRSVNSSAQHPRRSTQGRAAAAAESPSGSSPRGLQDNRRIPMSAYIDGRYTDLVPG